MEIDFDLLIVLADDLNEASELFFDAIEEGEGDLAYARCILDQVEAVHNSLKQLFDGPAKPVVDKDAEWLRFANSLGMPTRNLPFLDEEPEDLEGRKVKAVRQ